MRKALFLIAWLIQHFTFAQITGTVLDHATQPLPYANVLLLHAADSSMLKGVVTDLDGKFILDDIRPGEYRLMVRMVGFKTSIVGLDATYSCVMEPIVMEQESTLLNEVVINAEKPLFEQRIDRLVVNVEKSIVSSGGSVLDVLERSPGISVNRQNGSMSMNGKEGVQVMINGKLQRLPLNVVVQQLEGVTTGSVEKIELISNPSSRYDAEGDAGIINIITKKHTDHGTHGTATVGIGYSGHSGYFKPTASVNVDHRANDLSLFANYSMNSDRRWQQWNYERQVKDPDLYSDTRSNRYVRWPIQRASMGAEWRVTKRTSVNTLVSGFSDLWEMDSYNHSYIAQNGSDSVNMRLHDREVNHWRHVMGNINVNHSFANGGTLNVDADYLYYHDHNPSYFTNDYTFHQSGNTLQEEVRTGKETPINMGVLKLDYERQFNSIRLETGIKSTFSRLKNNVRLENRVGDTWIPDPRFTQNYVLKDDAEAAYVSVNGNVGRRGQFQLGLRAESTGMEMSADNKKIFELNFWKLFPTAFYSWKVNPKSSWQFSYGRRITRPSYANIAPWVIFMDPFTYYWGNPTIKPAISDAVQASYSRNDLLLTFKYSYDRNAIAGNQSRFDPEDRKTYIFADNVDLLQLYSLSFSQPVNITKWWTTQNNAFLSFQKTDHRYKDTPIALTQFSMRLSSSQRFSLPHDFTVELTAIYVAPRRIGLSYLKSMGEVSAGIQKKISERGKINLTITDIFWIRNSIYVNNNPVLGQIQQTSYYNEPRVWRLSYTCNFGNSKMKSGKQRSTASESEQQRMN